MPNLMSPITLGTLELKNRIIMPAMHLNYTEDSEVTDQLIEFYVERATGGAGLLIVGGCSTDEYSGGRELIGLDNDRYIPGLMHLTSAVHANGARIGAQLYHAGRYTHSTLIGRQALSASPLASRLTREVPREMSPDDIDYAIHKFAEAAARAKKSGFDLVEILGSAGYLISQFLSPVTNKRTDAYGGTLENRMRFGLAVVEAIRSAVGKDYPVTIRLAGNDFMPGSHTNKESAIFAREVEACGIDAFNITGGWHETRIPQIPMEVPRGNYVYLAQGIKKIVSKPVIACNRINNPILADKIIREGRADMVGIARGLIADPHLPQKYTRGKNDEIIPCIGCNQGCFDHILKIAAIECLCNPRAGHEAQTPPAKRGRAPQNVMVIGGGPAGLMAAKTAADAGHNVTLYEKEAWTGGQLVLAGALEERFEFLTLKDTLTTQARKAGVEIKTNTTVDMALVEAVNPDTVILATGGSPITPPIHGINLPHVKQAWDILAGKADAGDKIAVIGGGAVGIETSVLLAKIGTIDARTLQFLFLNQAEDIETLRELSTKGTKDVTLIEMLPRLGTDIGISTRWVELDLLERYGVTSYTGAKAVEITQSGVIIEREGQREELDCDTVIIAVGTKPENQLVEQLKDRQTIVIGDALKPRKAFDAIHEGFKAACSI